MATKKKKTPKKPSTKGKVIGGYYKPSKAQRAKTSKTKGLYAQSYQAEHVMRTGRLGSAKNAQKYRKTQRSAVKGLAVGGAGVLVGKGALKTGHNNLAAAGIATSIAGSGYSAYKQTKANQQLVKDTKTKRAAIWGYYKPTPISQRKAQLKTGVVTYKKRLASGKVITVKRKRAKRK